MAKFEEVLAQEQENSDKMSAVIALINSLIESQSGATPEQLDELLAVAQGTEAKIDDALDTSEPA